MKGWLGIVLMVVGNGAAYAESVVHQWWPDKWGVSAIVQSAEVEKAFGSMAISGISSITKSQPGTFWVSSMGCGLPVTVRLTYVRNRPPVAQLSLGQMLCASVPAPKPQ